MQITTKRLTIRRITAGDWKALQRIWKDFACSEYAMYDIPHPTADEEVQTKAAKWAEYNRSMEHLFFAVCLGEEMIGYIALHSRENGYETGYCFHSHYHGQGYAGESHRAIFDHLGKAGITRFTAGAALNNKPSVSLLRSLGFKMVGTESVAFHKDAQGNDLVFQGGIFALDTAE